jgi:hypothetical protein
MIIKTGRDLGTIVIDADGGEDIIEQIAKHGLGHALGLGHANYDGSLMADLVIEDKTATISECEINGVYMANSWKFMDSKQNPEHPQRISVSFDILRNFRK